MKKKDLRKLSRVDLLEMLLEQSKEIDRLKEEIKKKDEIINRKEIIMENCGSIADAAMQLNDIFVLAQEVANQYVDSVKASSIKLNTRNNEYASTYKENIKTCEQIKETTIETPKVKETTTKRNKGIMNFDLERENIDSFCYDIKDEDIKNWQWDV